MNRCVEIKQSFRMSEKIAKEIKSKTSCEVITTSFPSSNIIEFYVFMDAHGMSSTTEYRIVICQLVERIIDLDIYVNYLIRCLNAKVYVQGNIDSKSKVMYDIINYAGGFDIGFEVMDDTFYKDEVEYFFINENINIRASVEQDVFIIQDRYYGTTLLDFKTNTSIIKEAA